MTSSQIILYGFIALAILLFLRKFFVNRSLKHYSPAELDEKIQQHANLVLLDVRSGAERKEQHIKGSIHIPLHELSARLKELERYKGAEIVCYCLSGSRSLSAAAKLQKQGYTVANLKGGMAEWNFYHC